MRKFQSLLIMSFEILILEKKSAKPRTSPKFAIFDPMTLEIAISLEFFNTELILIRSSGAEVAIDTIVKPTTTLGILYFNDKFTDDFNK